MKKVLTVTPSLELEENDTKRLTQNSVELKQVATGKEAQEILGSSHYDVVVAELNLPDMSGDKLCCSIKESDVDTYVLLACSGKKSELKACGRCGADAHLQTPIDPDTLIQRISSILKVPSKRATRVLVKAKVNSSIHSEPFFSISHNISVSGMMLEAEQSLAMGDIISCSFYLPESERLLASCKVVRVIKPKGTSNQYGVEFLELDEDNRTLIESFIMQEREAGNFF